ncbi:LOW QUALITY PROTEIN: 60S acidic ribosomal protein P1 [Arabidopsis lyrata subsp. lyrata]|uniref:LOW QUALITY PROTEIN: 60S acidic ribosomal protein P1 n=1 Tax=Arabidopsis lyrata subsp. lyrata TaxID=81972 RepID=UPI000A29A5C2|nr:LOW QUALITY PROTEIN: 60S acidic ribosomal protein P1 [Arabidopsis lyrata subsp. lyrata]|eukprot:XP_020876077.1 LOW QUALITY PROTEIN: 60S acidic ribosomal protein P1 [Arabidopsis lyrata subsp. lyrata]
MSTSELACTYAALILHGDGIEITVKHIKLVKKANVNVESYWPSLFAKLCEKKNIDDLIMNVGAGGCGCGSLGPDTASAPAVSQSASLPQEKKNEKEEIKEESEDYMRASPTPLYFFL